MRGGGPRQGEECTNRKISSACPIQSRDFIIHAHNGAPRGVPGARGARGANDFSARRPARQYRLDRIARISLGHSDLPHTYFRVKRCRASENGYPYKAPCSCRQVGRLSAPPRFKNRVRSEFNDCRLLSRGFERGGGSGRYAAVAKHGAHIWALTFPNAVDGRGNSPQKEAGGSTTPLCVILRPTTKTRPARPSHASRRPAPWLPAIPITALKYAHVSPRWPAHDFRVPSRGCHYYLHCGIRPGLY